MSEKLSFLFYYNWEEQFIELEDDSERWNLLHNILKFETGRELDFQNKSVKQAFLGMKHGLISNQKKYEIRAERSRINGKKHTGKNKEINEITQQVILEPREPDNSKELIGNSKKIIDNSKELIDNSKEEIDNSKEEIGNSNPENPEVTYLEIMMDELFENLPDWRIKLLKLGDDEFMEKYKSYFVSSIKNENIIKKTYYYLVGKY
jgi:hypothetical protein